MQTLKLVPLQLFDGHSSKLQLYLQAQNTQPVDPVGSGCIHDLGSPSVFLHLQQTMWL